MQNPLLFQSAMRLVKTSLALAPGERVCVATDSNKLPIAEVFVAACAAVGAEPILVVMAPARVHGQEPPAIVAAAMRAAQVVIQPVTYAITHTDATKAALEAGARVLVLRGVTEDLLLEGAIGADYEEVGRLTAHLEERLTRASEMEVRSPGGTDITFSVRGRRGFSLSGQANRTGSFAAMPDGEAPISPVEGTANGTIVFEHSMDNLGLLDAPIEVEVREGRVRSIKGGRSAGLLRALIEGADAGAANLAEFAIGTNPKARLIGNMAEDKKLLGSVHFAVGDNHVLGGSVTSAIHLDGLVLRPTVVADGEVLVEEGKVAWPKGDRR